MRATKNIRRPFKRFEKSFDQPAQSQEQETGPEETVKVYADITANHDYAPVKLKSAQDSAEKEQPKKTGKERGTREV